MSRFQQAVDELETARRLIRKRRHWKAVGFGGGYAYRVRDADGLHLEPFGRMCAAHAMSEAGASTLALHLLRRASPFGAIESWNDLTVHRTVLWMFDRAIRKARRHAVQQTLRLSYTPSSWVVRAYRRAERDRLRAEERESLRRFVASIPRIDAVFVPVNVVHRVPVPDREYERV